MCSTAFVSQGQSCNSKNLVSSKQRTSDLQSRIPSSESWMLWKEERRAERAEIATKMKDVWKSIIKVNFHTNPIWPVGSVESSSPLKRTLIQSPARTRWDKRWIFVKCDFLWCRCTNVERTFKQRYAVKARYFLIKLCSATLFTVVLTFKIIVSFNKQ